ncbi:hypothetical protein PPERSA_12366 [Pseudocohnilembus persalinus]|uniref:Axonemal dynein light chain n=1 Tax=Pseudocohnilembus persalinus TaxID=266149 RepID=A0A0V0R8D3_PSEPJ|nr:hypothetical protein PPERSA_12366 [Pseudocohnilembus persalinus]|eukprot:KRX10745.1 hypothetical protein PPERSA_12366 [Pseudocohnilembus persalinus]
MAQIKTPISLVKYGNPILTSEPVEVKNIDPRTPQATTEDILNSILPPRITQLDQNQRWVQQVSQTPATRPEVIGLQENLDKRLILRQARETGICPIREELYRQCFDELIRQITINCSERGLLLVRIRDEFKQVVGTYQTLYESATSFGMRHILLSDLDKLEAQNKIKDLENQCSNLEQQVDELEQEIQDMIETDEKKRKKDQEDHQNQMNYLQTVNDKYEQQLKDMLDTGDLVAQQQQKKKQEQQQTGQEAK